MEQANRYLGGYRALTRHLFPRLSAGGSSVSVVDVGTGGAGLARLIADWARRHQVEVSVLAIDRARRHLAVASASTRLYPEIQLIQADGQCLPLPPRGADYLLSSLVLHHFAPESLIHFLRASYEAAARGLVMTDLLRGWLPYFAFRLVQPVFARNFLTRQDGATSIRRAYKPHELLALARAAGLHHARVYTHCPWRMTLVVDR
jgi:SAM-dependent methyltransferase